MIFLMYCLAFGWVLALFASVIGLSIWTLIKLYRWLTVPPDPKRQVARRREDWNPNHLKRAGQG